MQPHSSCRLYEGRVINLRLDEIDAVRAGGRRTVEIVEHTGGAVIIAQPSAREIVLVRQYRYAVGEELWELPAGMIETGEDPREAALRELEEETGYRAGSMHRLWSAYSSPGFCAERLHFFLAEDLKLGEQRLDDVEEIEVRTWPLDEAWALAESDCLRDAKTQIGLLWALRAGRG